MDAKINLSRVTSGLTVGKVMTAILLFLVLLITYFAYEVSKDLSE